MQIMVAISAAIMPEHYNQGRWHATGTIGVFGAAAAAGAILGLTPEEMCNAFGVCAGLCSGIQLNILVRWAVMVAVSVTGLWKRIRYLIIVGEMVRRCG